MTPSIDPRPCLPGKHIFVGTELEAMVRNELHQCIQCGQLKWVPREISDQPIAAAQEVPQAH